MDLRGERRPVRGAPARQLRAPRGRVQGEPEAPVDAGREGAGAVPGPPAAAPGQGRGALRLAEQEERRDLRAALEADAAHRAGSHAALRLDDARPRDRLAGRSVDPRARAGQPHPAGDGPGHALARGRARVQRALGEGRGAQVRRVEAAAAGLPAAAAARRGAERLGQAGRGGGAGAPEGQADREDRGRRALGRHRHRPRHDLAQVLSRSQLGHRQVQVSWLLLFFSLLPFAVYSFSRGRCDRFFLISLKATVKINTLFRFIPMGNCIFFFF